MSDMVGRHLGDYELLELIGHGAGGTVYRAYQPSLQRPVAIRVLDPELTAQPEVLEAYREAVLAAARLGHPNILRIHDLRSDEGVDYMVMDYAEGGSLRERLAAGPLDPAEALDLAASVADALAYGNDRGLVHGDLRPENILLDAAGHPLVADFGISRSLAPVLPDRQTAKPEYMSPEQAQGLPVTAKTDIYALGITLYEMLTGHVPFQGDTALGTLYKQVNQPLPRLRPLGLDSPRAQEVLDRATAKDPDGRFPSATDMGRDLRYAEAAASLPRPPAAVPMGTKRLDPVGPYTKSASKPARQTRWGLIAIVGILGLIAVTALSALMVSYFMGARDEGTPTTVPAATAVALADTATPAPTPLPTNTEVPATPTPTPSSTSTAASTGTFTPAATRTPVPTATTKPTGRAFAGGIKATATETLIPTPTTEPVPTDTAIPVDTPTPADTATATSTPEPTPTETPPAPPALVGRIAYPLYDPQTGRTDVWIAAGGGADRYQLAQCMRQPDFRGDGRLVLNGQGCGTDSLWAINADGGERREASHHPEDDHPTWSPGGGEIVYSSSQQGDGQWRLYRHSIDGDPPQSPPFIPLGTTGLLGRFPVWLSNGEIAYNGCDYGFGSGGNCGLWIAGAEGGVPRRLTTDSSDRAVDDSGGNLVFMSTRAGSWDIYRVLVDGSGLTRLTAGPGNNGLPTWSPDGRSIAFLSDRDGQWAIWVMGADGSNPRKLFDLNGTPGPNWTEERITWGP